MSTTFAVKVPSLDEEYEIEVEVAYRSRTVSWKEPLAQLLPDNTPVIATDNTHQGIYTIGDIRRAINKAKKDE